MTIKKIMFLSSLLLTTAVGEAQATAAGSYLGFTAGLSNTHNKTENVQLGTTPETSAPVSPSSTGMAGGFIIGYGFNPYAAFELGYTHYASTTYKKPADSLVVNDATINTNAVDLAVKGSFPFRAVSLFGKLGLAEVFTSGSGSLAPLDSTKGPNETALRPLYGIGVSYDITQNWVADISYTTFSGGSGVHGADSLLLGVSYHFVDLMCGQFLC